MLDNLLDFPSDNASNEEILQFLKKNSEKMLRYLISEGERGYKGEISRFEPQPCQANNWLYDTEECVFRGKFFDDTSNEEEGFYFEIRKDGESWLWFYKPVSEDSWETSKKKVGRAMDANRTLIETGMKAQLIPDTPFNDEQTLAIYADITDIVPHVRLIPVGKLIHEFPVRKGFWCISDVAEAICEARDYHNQSRRSCFLLVKYSPNQTFTRCEFQLAKFCGHE